MSTGTDERDHPTPAGSGEGDSGQAEREAAELARIVAQRAIRRLDILEYVMFFAGAVLATVAGALAAWLLEGIAGWDFRTTWVWGSIVLFVVPGTIAIIMIKRDERSDARRAAERDRDDV
jgi:uncharacterized membrane protein